MAGQHRGVAALHGGRRHGRAWLVAAVAVLALAGCEGGSGAGNGTPERRSAGDARDVEAPEVFDRTELALWDGRPSLGGVWVAHPDVDDPERVVIRNPEGDSLVIGALFRRERENPGPRLQLSSDAAAALRILAGQPTTLQVTALRREEAAPEPEAAPEAAPEAPPETAGAEAPPPRPEPAEAQAVAAETAPDSAAPDTPPRRFGLFRRRAPAAEAEAPAAPQDSITTTALDAPSPADDAPAAAPPRPAAPDAAPGTPARAYVQLGIFSIEANAERAAGMLRDDGQRPVIRREIASGQTYWRVLAGPAASEAERDRLLAAVRALGFADAYAVRR